MAKKIKNEEVVLEEPKQVIQPKKEKITSKDNWEVKDCCNLSKNFSFKKKPNHKPLSQQLIF